MEFDLIESTYNICPEAEDKKQYVESVYQRCKRRNPDQETEIDKAFSFLFDMQYEYNKFLGNVTILDFTNANNGIGNAENVHRIANLPLMIQIDQVISYMKRFNYEGKNRRKIVAEVKEYTFDQDLMPYILLAILCRNYVYVSETHISYIQGYFFFTYLSTLNKPTRDSILQNAKKNWMVKICIEDLHLTSYDQLEKALFDDRLTLTLQDSSVSLQFKGSEASSTNTLKLRILKYLNSKETASRKELSQYFEVSDRWMNKMLNELEEEKEIKLNGNRKSPYLTYSLK